MDFFLFFGAGEWICAHEVEQKDPRPPHRDRDRQKDEEPANKGRQLQTVVWLWGGGASPALSFLKHAVRWGATIPEGRQKAQRDREDEEGRYRTHTGKERRSTGFSWLHLRRKRERKKENYCADFFFNEKNVFILSLNQSEETDQEVVWKPFSGNTSYREKSWNRAHTHAHTHIHSHI